LGSSSTCHSSFGSINILNCLYRGFGCFYRFNGISIGSKGSGLGFVGGFSSSSGSGSSGSSGSISSLLRIQSRD
jgi:hypothetical protein